MPAFPTFLDFEASSLALESFPIEVAWNDPREAIESHLISPEGVGHWEDWSDAAEKLHGISRAVLLRCGKAPASVCAQLLRVLNHADVFSDCPAFDGEWLAKLFEAGEAKLPAGFKLRDYREISCIHTLKPEDWIACQTAARHRVGGQHRAASDVLYLMEVYRLAKWINPR